MKPTRADWKELEDLIMTALKASDDVRAPAHKAMWDRFFRLAYHDDPTVERAGSFTPRRRHGHFEIKRRLADPGECTTCDEYRETGEKLFPSHDASDRCESGKHNHCTCDVCF